MEPNTLIIIGSVTAVIAAIVVVALIAYTNTRERNHLKDTFGSEYDDTYARAVDRKAARAELKAREERVSSYELHELDAKQRHAFATQWQGMQATFVDDPHAAVSKADVLLAEVMRARGYQTDPWDQEGRIADVSVGHGEEAAAFREATKLAALNRAGRATTEDMRRAIKDYAVVFDSLLHEKQPA